jgi:hypothetical protein
MSDTPKTDEVLRMQHNFGAYQDGSGDGVTAQEAYEGMVSSLEHLCKRLERELNAAGREIAGWHRYKANIEEALNQGDGKYQP